MWTTFRQGQAVMLTTHLERAELYVEQLQHRGLRATWESV
jgi:ATP-dependent Clp protease adapter protein ClpS